MSTPTSRTTSLIAFLSLAAAFASPALAQTVTVTVNGVASDKGSLLGQLCNDAAKFPASGCIFNAMAAAKAGSVDLVFNNVPAGAYAFQTFHDADGNMRPSFPQEGYAFGNNQPYPATFEQAAIKVAGDTKASVKLIYMAGAQAASTGDAGAAPPPGVIKTDLRANGLYGALYAPQGAAKLPAILAIGGSEGGLDSISAISESFALHGYTVLALAYWRAPGLPQSLEGIPLEYFDKALAWLKQRPEVDASRIGMMGWSRGGEGALLYSSHTPDIHAVMSLAGGSHVVVGINQTNFAQSKPAWTLKGEPIPYFMPDLNVQIVNGNFRKMMDESHRDVTKHPEAEIPVEKINGPILLLSGGKDGVWNSDAQAERVIARLKAKGFKPEARHLNFPDAGHLVFTGDPAVPAGAAVYKGYATIMGGSPEANAAAQAETWKATLAFFDKALKR